jgi:hypothetical protein
MLTAAGLRRRRQPLRLVLLYGALALVAGAALFVYGR